MILSIDPGYDRIGIAIMKKEKQKELVIYSECFQTNKKDDLNTRIFSIGNHLNSLIDLYKPDTLAIEKLFMNTNQKTIIGVSEAKGVIKFICLNRGMKVFEYTPLQIKTATTGYGRATKSQVTDMVCKITNINSSDKIDDELDAIAIGITHFAHARPYLKNNF